MEYPTIIDDMESPKLNAYSLETVVAEKFQTMVEKSVFNSRMKDFYDLYRIITVHKFDEETLLTAIKATFENRHTDFSEGRIVFTHEFATDDTLEKHWKAFCNKTKIENPLSFQETMQIITDFIKPYWEKLQR